MVNATLTRPETFAPTRPGPEAPRPLRGNTEYVYDLNLALPRTSLHLGSDRSQEVLTEGKNTQAVNSGSLESFAADLTGQARHDALNSTLLASLAANHYFDREKQAPEWYGKYREVLENVGWDLQGFQFSRLAANESSFSMNDLVIRVLAAILTDNDLKVVQDTLKLFKSLGSGDNRVKLFNHESCSKSDGNFQVARALQTNGLVSMGISAFYFAASQEVTDVLWYEFSSSNVSVYGGAQVMTLNNDVYSQVRDAVIQKLGDRAKKYIQSLPDLPD